MAVLKTTNVQGALCVNGVAIGGGKDIKFCCFTASTTFTPSQTLVDGGGYVEASLVAGGGGGGGVGFALFDCDTFAMSGGGGGGEVRTTPSLITATDACTVTVGAAGGPGKVLMVCSGNCIGISSPATNGGDTTFLGETTYGGSGGTTIAYKAAYWTSLTTPAVNGPIGGPGVGGRVIGCSWAKTYCCRCGYGGSSTSQDVNFISDDWVGPSSLNFYGGTATSPNISCAFKIIGDFNPIPYCANVSSSNGLTVTDDNLASSISYGGIKGGGTGILNGQIAGAGGGHTSFIFQPSTAASSVYGGGGAGNKAQGTTSNPGGTAVNCDGTSGSSGLVILKWEE